MSYLAWRQAINECPVLHGFYEGSRPGPAIRLSTQLPGYVYPLKQVFIQWWCEAKRDGEPHELVGIDGWQRQGLRELIIARERSGKVHLVLLLEVAVILNLDCMECSVAAAADMHCIDPVDGYENDDKTDAPLYHSPPNRLLSMA